jgi:hypothetical protein
MPGDSCRIGIRQERDGFPWCGAPIARLFRWPEEHVVAVSWIISGWVYVELRVAGAVARALPDPAGRGLGGGQVKRSRTCVVGAAGSGLWA